jgi:PAS domain S-box-containing protein
VNIGFWCADVSITVERGQPIADMKRRLRSLTVILGLAALLLAILAAVTRVIAARGFDRLNSLAELNLSIHSELASINNLERSLRSLQSARNANIGETLALANSEELELADVRLRTSSLLAQQDGRIASRLSPMLKQSHEAQVATLNKLNELDEGQPVAVQAATIEDALAKNNEAEIAAGQIHAHLNRMSMEELGQTHQNLLAALLASFAGLAVVSAVGFVASRRIVGQMHQQLEEQHQQVERLSSAKDLSVIVLEATSDDREIQDALKETARRFVELFNWRLGHIIIESKAGNFASSRIWIGDESDQFEQLKKVSETLTFKPGEDLPGEVLLSQEPVWYSDVAACQSSRRFRVITNLSLKAGFAFPIVVDGSVRAIIEVFDTHERPMEDVQIEASGFLRYCLGSLFERQENKARLEEQEQQLRMQFSQLEMQQRLLDAQQETCIEQQAALENTRLELEQREWEILHRISQSHPVLEPQAESSARRDHYEVAARRFEDLFNGIPMACYTCDAQGSIYEWNTSAEELWGHHSHTMLQSNVLQLFEAAHQPEVDDYLRRALTGEAIENVEIQAIDKGGRHFWVLGSIIPIRGPQRDITGAVWSFVDITDRKIAESRIKESESRFRTSMESMCNAFRSERQSRIGESANGGDDLGRSGKFATPRFPIRTLGGRRSRWRDDCQGRSATLPVLAQRPNAARRRHRSQAL